MIPAPNPDLFPLGPFVLVEEKSRHVMRIARVRDWGDGKGPIPDAWPFSVCEWKMSRARDPQGKPAGWRGFKPSDVAAAHKLLVLLNADWESMK